MSDLFIVASYTIKEMLKKKSFIISNLIILIIIVIGFNVPNILNVIKGDEVSASKTLIIDSQNLFEGSLDNLVKLNKDKEFIIKNEQVENEEIKKQIENGEIKEAIVIKQNNEKINVEYIVDNIAMTDGVPETLINQLTSIYENLQLSKLNLTQEQLLSLNPNFNFEIKQANDQEVKGNVIVVMLLSLVLFYAIYFCAYQVSTSITTEKTSKIMETLVTSTKPKIIVIGKTLGIGIVGLIQIVVIVSVALISAKLFLPTGLLDSVLDLSQITIGLGIISIAYFILGYATYALLYALTGSTVSKPEEVQSANGPVAFIAIIGFYLAYFTMMNPTSQLNVFASIFPFSAPFCMPFRIMMGVATPTQVIISIIVLIVTIIIVANISIKIYSNSILNYGSRVTFKDMIKMYKRKDDNNN